VSLKVKNGDEEGKGKRRERDEMYWRVGDTCEEREVKNQGLVV
jgi:hypothetical protein